MLVERGNAGCVRRCHGDLHLGNIVLIDNVPVPFDALEFSEALATIDVLYDLAFLLMDLDARGDRQAANAVFNAYVAFEPIGGEIEGLACLPLFLACRAGVRAVVAMARTEQLEEGQQAALRAEIRRNAALAGAYLAPRQADPHRHRRSLGHRQIDARHRRSPRTSARRPAPCTCAATWSASVCSACPRRSASSASTIASARRSASTASSRTRRGGPSMPAIPSSSMPCSPKQDERAAIEAIAREAGARSSGCGWRRRRTTLIARVEAQARRCFRRRPSRRARAAGL